MNGPKARWTQEHELLASVVDVLAMANYQRGGNKGSRPKRFPRPGMTGKKLGTAVSVEEMRQILDDWHTDN